jgi:hypothetical protein
MTRPVLDTGSAFYFHPDSFVQRTTVWFSFARLSKDPSNLAVFKWTYTPPDPTRPGQPKRPPISGSTLVSPPTEGLNNVPSYLISFPFHPNDWTKGAENNAKIEIELVGIQGEWADNPVYSGKISLFEPVVALKKWEFAGLEVKSLRDELAIPNTITQPQLYGYFFL